MGKKLSTVLVALCLAFAIITAGISIYFLIQERSYVKCNKFKLGASMEENKDCGLSDYEQLLSELNRKYFEKVCDVFDEAKTELLDEMKDLLGEPYAKLNEEVEALKKEALTIRRSFDAEEETVELKERLEIAKAEFVEAESDEARVEKKGVLNAVLSEIANRNLKVFSKMAEIRKQIDEKCIALTDVIKSKEADYKALEKTVVSKARNKTLELSVSYGSEVSALSFAFDVKDFPSDMPFLKVFDPNMRLMDFNKKAFMDSFTGKKRDCGPKCSGDCRSCHGEERKNYFTSETKDDFKN